MKILTALEHHQAGRLAQAISIYQSILMAQPDNPDALHLLGNAAGPIGKVDYSIELIARLHAGAGQYHLALSLATAYRVKT